MTAIDYVSYLQSQELEQLDQVYVNRELSWLEFNSRVLWQAQHEDLPLLERLRFVIIFYTNLDEFMMKRVAKYRRRLEITDDPLESEQLRGIYNQIKATVHGQTKRADSYYRDILVKLGETGIHVRQLPQLSKGQMAQLTERFYELVHPTLTPLIYDPSHPFPLISNLSTNLALRVFDRATQREFMARLKIPDTIPNLVAIDGNQGSYDYVPLVDMICHFLPTLFEGSEIRAVSRFRVTRHAEIAADDYDGDYLIDRLEQGLKDIKFNGVVRMQVQGAADPKILQFLMNKLELTEDDIYPQDLPLNLPEYCSLLKLPRDDLLNRPWQPLPSKQLMHRRLSMFEFLEREDLFVHHPYDSFQHSVQRFVEEAAVDPLVLAIKMTLYRTDDDSRLIQALIEAASSGKHVVVVIELTARFDEARNIYWANQLEKVGAHVVYGVRDTKTHAKTILVVRRNEDFKLRCYAHIGTGNYNAATAGLYTDFGLFTADPTVTQDLVNYFKFLTAYSRKNDYKKLLVAPINFRSQLEEWIDGEIAAAQSGRGATIVLKCNGLSDLGMVRKLYEASSAGVRCLLFVRGECSVRPGVPGLSDHITVVSVVGRFLEHSRVYYFSQGATDPLDGVLFMGSADWMSRNLSRRVEVALAIDNRAIKERIWRILMLMGQDNQLAWVMQPDGSYLRKQKKAHEDVINTHEILMQSAGKGEAPHGFPMAALSQVRPSIRRN